MRIVAIGLGGAGSRIVDRLYASDRRSSKVACVQAIAVDVDEPTLKQLGGLPEQGRLFFPPLDLGVPHARESSAGPTATIDISEILSKVQNLQSGETDAIIVCCGLGGSMVDVAPHIIAGLRSSVTEPIFGLLTLPCLAEGERISSKAADDIDMLQPLLDGVILFDNETWYKKIKAEKAHLTKKERGFAEKLGIKKSEQEISPVQATYSLLNDGIVRRISLVLRAGEFKADGGIDLAEVVLDSGEVLNTMKGMGFIAIGYAVERLPPDPLGFLSRFKPSGIFNEEQKKKASRIVELAKQAIYHEVSTPCDMTSAHKALILIAGPSHELSMKGYMTVRKWIDRSIAGLETRSGDYPVVNTKNVAIIIMLSGLENIPRLTEIREIRSQFMEYKQKPLNVPPSLSAVGDDAGSPEDIAGTAFPESRAASSGDDLISLPARQQAAGRSPAQAPLSTMIIREPQSGQDPGAERQTSPGTISQHPIPAASARPEYVTPSAMTDLSHEGVRPHMGEHKGGSPVRGKDILSRRLIVSQGTTEQHIPRARPVPHPSVTTGVSSGPVVPGSPVPETGKDGEKAGQRPEKIALKGKESERQRIERELQRQRELAIPGSGKKVFGQPQKVPVSTPAGPAGQQSAANNLPEHNDREQHQAGRGPTPVQPVRTVIVPRKSLKLPVPASESGIPDTTGGTDGEAGEYPSGKPNPRAGEGLTFRTAGLKAKDGIFEGQPTRRTVVKPQPRDSGLIHTDITTKKQRREPGRHEPGDQEPDTTPDSDSEKKQTSSDTDDVSWE